MWATIVARVASSRDTRDKKGMTLMFRNVDGYENHTTNCTHTCAVRGLTVGGIITRGTQINRNRQGVHHISFARVPHTYMFTPTVFSLVLPHVVQSSMSDPGKL